MSMAPWNMERILKGARQKTVDESARQCGVDGGLEGSRLVNSILPLTLTLSPSDGERENCLQCRD